MPHPYGAQNLVMLEPEGISEIIPSSTLSG